MCSVLLEGTQRKFTTLYKLLKMSIFEFMHSCKKLFGVSDAPDREILRTFIAPTFCFSWVWFSNAFPSTSHFWEDAGFSCRTKKGHF